MGHFTKNNIHFNSKDKMDICGNNVLTIRNVGNLSYHGCDFGRRLYRC